MPYLSKGGDVWRELLKFLLYADAEKQIKADDLPDETKDKLLIALQEKIETTPLERLLEDGAITVEIKEEV